MGTMHSIGIFELLVIAVLIVPTIVAIVVVTLAVKSSKNKMRAALCPVCGSPLPQSSDHCPRCGNKIAQ